MTTPLSQQRCLAVAYEQLDQKQRGLWQRVLSQVQFARNLTELHRQDEWMSAVDEAEQYVQSAFQKHQQAVTDVTADVESILNPLAPLAKSYTVHGVGHAHIDMNWRWGWAETVATVIDTFTTVLALMEEFPAFHFSQSQGAIYEIVRNYHPAMFDQIRRRVAEGRWEVTASQWVEGDKNLPCGESLVRHLLYTRQYMHKHLGLTAEDVSIAWEPDTFGHAATIPDILAKGGVRWYYMLRGGQEEKPPLFWWQGTGENKVLVYLDHAWCNNVIGPENIRGLMWFVRETGLKDWLLNYGIGDHGGGPTRRDLRMFEEMNNWPVFPTFHLTTARAYFSMIEQHGHTLPTLKGEMNFEYTGCYSSQSLIKRNNRFGEMACLRAERFEVLNQRLLGRSSPKEMLRRAWLDVLFGHFHDILPGSCVAATRQYHCAAYQNIAAATGQVSTQALRAIADVIDTSFASRSSDCTHLPFQTPIGFGAGIGRATRDAGVSMAGHFDCDSGCALVIFNPSPHTRRDVLTFSLWDVEGGDVAEKEYQARTPDGATIPLQRRGSGDYWGHGFLDLAVPVEVPAMAYSVMSIEPTGIHSKPGTLQEWDVRRAKPDGALSHADMRYERGGVLAGEWALENQDVRVELDSRSGGIARFVDKRSGRVLIDTCDTQPLLEFANERPGRMSSWVIQPAQFRYPARLIDLSEKAIGPHEASIEAKYSVGNSDVSLIYTLKSGMPWVDIQIRAHWREIGGEHIGVPSLRLRLPLNMSNCEYRFETPFGAIDRGIKSGQEVPTIRWVNVIGQSAHGATGLAVINDCTYSFSMHEASLTATLIRSSYEPDRLPEMGEHEIGFRLVPHCADASDARLCRWAEEFNQPLQAVTTTAHSGTLPTHVRDAVHVVPNNSDIVIEAIMVAEQEDAVIFRLRETAGRKTRSVLSLDSTLLGEVASVCNVDLLENRSNVTSTEIMPDGVGVSLDSFEIASVKVKFTKRA